MNSLGAIMKVLGSAIPGILALVGVFRKPRSSVDIGQATAAEVMELEDWKEKCREEARRARGTAAK